MNINEVGKNPAVLAQPFPESLQITYRKADGTHDSATFQHAHSHSVDLRNIGSKAFPKHDLDKVLLASIAPSPSPSITLQQPSAIKLPEWWRKIGLSCMATRLGSGIPLLGKRERPTHFTQAMPTNTPPLPNWIGPASVADPSNVCQRRYVCRVGWNVARRHRVAKLFLSRWTPGEYDLGYDLKLAMVLEGPTQYVMQNANLGYFRRGYTVNIGAEDSPNNWIITNSKISPQRGGKRRVTINWQSLSGYLAPDEWDIDREDQRPRVERHPAFRSLTVEDFATVKLAFQPHPSVAVNQG